MALPPDSRGISDANGTHTHTNTLTYILYIYTYIGWLFLQILVGYLMLMAAFVITDLFILHKFDNVHLMAAYDNRAVALIEGVSACVLLYWYY